MSRLGSSTRDQDCSGYGGFDLEYIFDCRITESTLNRIVQLFVPERDVYYFYHESIANNCLNHGLTVYSRQEFASTFPLFALNYGPAYHLWSMKLPKDAFVLVAHPSELEYLATDIRKKLLGQQIAYGRGHIYDMDWFDMLQLPQTKNADFEGMPYYFLTWDDWWKLTPEVRRRWVVEWLREWRKEDAGVIGFVDFPHYHEGVPYELIKEYAGTFGPASTANCFAGAIAMVVGIRNPFQSRVLISEWLHQGPFFRLLEGQGYMKHTECMDMNDMTFQPTDVLVWYTREGIASHAGYAVSHELVFQKQAQGWDNPWQVLKINDVWYNEYLKTVGYIAVFRRNG